VAFSVLRTGGLNYIIEIKMLLFVETFLLVLCAAIAAVGYGSGLSAILQIESNLGDRGILGLLSFGFLGCLLHFVIPLTPAVHLAILAGGVSVAVVSRTGLRNPTVVWAAAAIISIYVLSHHQSNLNYDGGLYYLQTMRWITEHQIVPGLGNLHGRLAFNSMIFLIAGVADHSGIGWISNLLVVLFVLISLFIRLRNVTTEGRRSGIEFWVIVLSILILSSENRYISGWYGVLNADSFTAILIIYWTCVALGLSVSPHLETDLTMLVLSAVLAVAVKVSAAPLLLPTVALAWIHRKRLPAPSTWRVALAASLVLGLWMLRGITLSGCAIYPVSQTCISALPWAESEQQVSSESLWIRSWARQRHELPAQVLKDRAWLPRWFSGAQHDHSIRLLVIFAPLGLIAALLRRNFHGKPAHCLLVVTSGLIGCLIFWFVTAPDPRFGEGFMLAAALLGGSIAFAVCFDQPRFAVYVPALVVASMALVSIRGLWRVKSDYFYAVSEAPTYQLRGPNGTRIFVPKEDTDQCWDHQLPCTPYFDPAALARIGWPANWPVPPPGWSPDDALGVVRKDLNGAGERDATQHPKP
jgi:hypothetical protein